MYRHHLLPPTPPLPVPVPAQTVCGQMVLAGWATRHGILRKRARTPRRVHAPPASLSDMIHYPLSHLTRRLLTSRPRLHPPTRLNAFATCHVVDRTDVPILHPGRRRDARAAPRSSLQRCRHAGVEPSQLSIGVFAERKREWENRRRACQLMCWGVDTL